jgi:hypothetical protein
LAAAAAAAAAGRLFRIGDESADDVRLRPLVGERRWYGRFRVREDSMRIVGLLLGL